MAFQLANTTKVVTSTARRDLLSGGEVRLYSGAQPANPQTAATGLLLATIALPTPCGTVSTTGTTVKLTITLPLSYVTTSGTLGYARFCRSTGAVVMDGECGIPGSSAAVIISPASGTPSLAVFAGGELTASTVELSE